MRAFLKREIYILLSIGLLVLANSTVFACGMSWLLPKSHFEGVDEMGYLMYSEKLDEITLKSGRRLPIIALFETDIKTSSSYLGNGWILPMLESRIEQLDENTFRLWQPDGWTRKFTRNKKSPAVLDNGSGWKGVIDGDRITVWSDCGARIEFYRGKIVLMQLGKDRLNYSYLGNLVTEIRQESEVVVKINFNSNGSRPTDILLSHGNKIAWELGEMPVIQVINGKNLVGRIDRSLTALKINDKSIHNFEYGTDEQLRPTFSRDGKIAVWDAKTGFILKDDGWSYKIDSPMTTRQKYSSIQRTNARGESEYWGKSPGKEVVITKNGIKTVSEWFTSGPLAGRFRKKIKTANGREQIEYEAVYDEKGKIIRENQGEYGKYEYTYDKQGNLIKSQNSNGSVELRNYDDQNRLASIQQSSGKISNFYYADSHWSDLSYKEFIEKLNLPQFSEVRKIEIITNINSKPYIRLFNDKNKVLYALTGTTLKTYSFDRNWLKVGEEQSFIQNLDSVN